VFLSSPLDVNIGTMSWAIATFFNAMLFACRIPVSYSCAAFTSSLGISFAAARADSDKRAVRRNILADGRVNWRAQGFQDTEVLYSFIHLLVSMEMPDSAFQYATTVTLLKN
jgi:hypothetical protein